MRNYNYDRFDPADYDFSIFLGPKAGETMDDFCLHDTQGKKICLSDFKGKKVVIETGSKTCPVYVNNIKSMNRLSKKYPEVIFIVLYIREAHPGERQKGHTSMEEKIECAAFVKKYEPENRIILVDSLKGDTHLYLGGLPEMLYILDEERKVLRRSTWLNTEVVDKVLSGQSTEKDRALEFRGPTKPDPWTMLRVTFRGGFLGFWDLLKSLRVLMAKHRKNDAN